MVVVELLAPVALVWGDARFRLLTGGRRRSFLAPWVMDMIYDVVMEFGLVQLLGDSAYGKWFPESSEIVCLCCCRTNHGRLWGWFGCMHVCVH